MTVLPELPPVENEAIDFKIRFLAQRKCAIDLWHIRVNYIFIVRLHVIAPHLKNTVKTPGAFVEWHRNTKPNDKNVRALVHQVLHKMISKTVMKKAEGTVMDKMYLVYLNSLVDGTPCATKRQTGSCLKIGQQVKQCVLFEPIRKAGFNTFGEVVYEREKKRDPETGLFKNVLKGVVMVHKVTEQGWGIEGHVGVSATHWSMLEQHKEASRQLALPSEEGLKAWLNEKAKAGETDITKLLLERDAKSTKAATITIASEGSPASTLTTTDVSVSIRMW